MNKPPAFQFYAKDWNSDLSVKLMTLAQRGAYISLLAHNWTEGKLPAKLSALARLIDANQSEFDAVWPAIKGKFAPVDGDPESISNPRMDADRVAMEQRRLAQSDAGKATQALLRTEGRHPAKLKAKSQPAVAVASAVASATSTRNNSKESPVAPQRAFRETWLTPYIETWVAHYGGNPSAGELANFLGPLRSVHGDPAVKKAWENYLSHTEAQYANPARFAKTYGSWTGNGPKPKPTQRDRNITLLNHLADQEETA